MARAKAKGAADQPKRGPGRPPSGKPPKDGRQVRVDPAMAMMAAAVATARGMTIGEYLASLCLDRIRADYGAVLRGETPEGGG